MKAKVVRLKFIVLGLFLVLASPAHSEHFGGDLSRPTLSAESRGKLQSLLGVANACGERAAPIAASIQQALAADDANIAAAANAFAGIDPGFGLPEVPADGGVPFTPEGDDSGSPSIPGGGSGESVDPADVGSEDSGSKGSDSESSGGSKADSSSSSSSSKPSAAGEDTASNAAELAAFKTGQTTCVGCHSTGAGGKTFTSVTPALVKAGAAAGMLNKVSSAEAAALRKYAAGQLTL